MKLLNRPFFTRDTVTVAKDLLGKIIIRKYEGTVLKGMIVETEAYTSNDPACHAFKGKTNRNCALFGEVGHAYVYFIYGNHYCLNFVARTNDMPAGGVLIRALEPINGIETIKKLRKTNNIHELTNGPGKLTQALAIDRSFNGIDITKKNDLYVIDAPLIPKNEIGATSRIGITNGQDKLWRFIIKNNPFVPKHRA